MQFRVPLPQVTPRFGVSQSTIFPANPNAIVGGLIVVTPDKQMVASAGAAAGGTGVLIPAGARSSRMPSATTATKSLACSRRRRSTRDSATTARPARGATIPTEPAAAGLRIPRHFIHAIHGSDKREKPFTWHASAVGKSFADIGYPGILSKCETCHLPGTYDFSAPASASALPNRLYRTVGTGSTTRWPVHDTLCTIILTCHAGAFAPKPRLPRTRCRPT